MIETIEQQLDKSLTLPNCMDKLDDLRQRLLFITDSPTRIEEAAAVELRLTLNSIEEGITEVAEALDEVISAR